MRRCPECDMPLHRCICEMLPCYRCGSPDCEGECEEINLGDPLDIDLSDGPDELNFDDHGDAA